MTVNDEPIPYLYFVIDPERGALVGFAGSDGRRAVEFAHNTGCAVVRVRVEQAEHIRTPNGAVTVWRRRDG